MRSDSDDLVARAGGRDGAVGEEGVLGLFEEGVELGCTVGEAGTGIPRQNNELQVIYQSCFLLSCPCSGETYWHRENLQLMRGDEAEVFQRYQSISLSVYQSQLSLSLVYQCCVSIPVYLFYASLSDINVYVYLTGTVCQCIVSHFCLCQLCPVYACLSIY